MKLIPIRLRWVKDDLSSKQCAKMKTGFATTDEGLELDDPCSKSLISSATNERPDIFLDLDDSSFLTDVLSNSRSGLGSITVKGGP